MGIHSGSRGQGGRGKCFSCRGLLLSHRHSEQLLVHLPDIQIPLPVAALQLPTPQRSKLEVVAQTTTFLAAGFLGSPKAIAGRESLRG
jgi:hypothetical protein